MKIKDYKCKCGHDQFFFHDNGSQVGIYCEYCGKWYKWANKDELNLALNKIERKKGRWIRKSPDGWMWTCSCCKKDDAYAYSAGESFEPDVLQDLFCPNCGADMRE